MPADRVAPMLFAIILLLLALSTAALADGVTIVALGDSITFGANLKPEESYPAQLQTLLHAQPGHEQTIVVNAGIGGNTVLQGLARLNQDVLTHKPRAVLIGFGMNDSVMVAAGKARVPVEEFTRSLTELVHKVQACGAVVILAPLTPVIEAYYFDRHPREWYFDGLQPQLNRYTAAIRAVAAQTGAILVDLSGLDPAKHLRTEANSHSRDGVHPTAEGYAVIAQAYAAALAAAVTGDN